MFTIFSSKIKHFLKKASHLMCVKKRNTNKSVRNQQQLKSG